jgi:ABC-type phosphate transport system substrate-binding protein
MVTRGMGGPISRVSRDVRGIGYSVYFYEQLMAANAGLKLCAIDGVVPSYASIRRKTYPLTSDVYAVIRPDLPPDHAARQLRDWLVSKKGQQIVKASGYVPAR